MGTITNRDDRSEQANQAKVAARKQKLATDQIDPGIRGGDDQRLQTHKETEDRTLGTLSSDDSARIGQGRDRRTGEKK
jgi:hypothetical protein